VRQPVTPNKSKSSSFGLSRLCYEVRRRTLASLHPVVHTQLQTLMQLQALSIRDQRGTCSNGPRARQSNHQVTGQNRTCRPVGALVVPRQCPFLNRSQRRRHSSSNTATVPTGRETRGYKLKADSRAPDHDPRSWHSLRRGFAHEDEVVATWEQHTRRKPYLVPDPNGG
jgi:hypothetical protein